MMILRLRSGNVTSPDLVAGSAMAGLRSVVLAGAILFAAAVHGELKIEVTEGVEGRIPITVVSFGSPREGGRSIDQVIASDLAYTGLFSIVPPEEVKPLPLNGSIDIDKWLAQGTEKLVFGAVRRRDEKNWEVQAVLYDIVQRKRLFGQEIKTLSLTHAAHYISDKVYEEFTGVTGIFRTRLAFVASERVSWRSHQFALYVSDVDGHNAVRIFTSDAQLMSPTWSPDLKKLAYVSYESGQPEIIIQTLVTAERRSLSQHIGSAVAPDWSSDGRRLAYVSSAHGNPDVYTVQLDTLHVTRITGHSAIDTEPSWMPDGTILFTSDRSGQPQLYQSGSGDQQPRRVTYTGVYNSDADVSPDGGEITFLGVRNRVFSILVKDLQTGHERVLASSLDIERPRFAANGRLVGYLAAGGTLGLLTTDGKFGKPLKVPGVGSVRSIAWSPLPP